MKTFFKFLFCGILSGFLFPPFFIFPLGFITFPYLFFLLIDNDFVKKRKFFQFFSGIFYGIGFTFIVLVWIKDPFFVNQGTENYFYFSYLLVIYCSIFYGFAFLILSLFQNRISKLILLPFLFVLIEILRENIGFGFPWIVFSQVYSGNGFLLNLIYYLGTYGLSYFSILLFLFPASIVLFYSQTKYIPFLKIYILVSISLISTFFFLSLFRNFINFKDNGDSKDLSKISIVQINESLNFRNNLQIQEQINIIKKIISNNKSDLIVFGENQYPALISDNEDLKILINEKNYNQKIIIGGTKTEFNNSSSKPKFYNTMYLIENELIHEFKKKILVPFGEFLPFRNYLSILGKIVGDNDFSSGNQSRIITTSDGIKIIPIICYEIIFFNDIITNENYENSILVNITNDSWFGNISGPYQHFYLSRMRAAEFNKNLIRVSNNGISAIISNKGDIVDYIPLNSSGIKEIKINYIYSNNLLFYHNLFYIWLFIIGFFAIIINRINNE